ncbi:class I SAM-dependent methyltransferase [Promicromonospora soli]|uniref:SAM-dependent methyltransferase n=1 Tax=Promicromonospora soli TaxID=2035533 RepID=A0A919FIW0_9MICO|nr:class I SAM-dependent methyltransferase [Promicromonospora soli]GHH66698.1 SAM-dependent methyltransferase [Promicromonospora soli]
MAFNVAADAYARFMGRFAEPLADRFVDLVDARSGQRALDVGCGPGAVTERLSRRLGPDAVVAVDPSEPFVEAARGRCPGVDVRQGVAEALPFDDDTVDLALAQLVVHFMTDPVAGLREMARVARPGGVVAASVWDFGGGRAPLSTFWRAARDLEPGMVDESAVAGAGDGHLAGLFRQAGLHDLRSHELTVVSRYADFTEWWEPYTLGVGLVGDYIAGLEPDARRAVETRCRELLPDGPFEVTATAWTVIARA